MADRIGFFEAIERAYAAIATTASEVRALTDCLGRVTAAPVSAVIAHPPFDCSAMDGFALHRDDLATRELKVGAPIYAGDGAPPLVRGVALPIATGAPVPHDCGAVIQNEIAGTVANGTLHRDADAIPGRNIRRRGEDVAPGEIVLAAGRRVTPVLTGTLACFGVTQVEVRRRPRVVILSGGAELGDGPARIPDANAPMLLAMALEAGADAVSGGTLPDDDAAVARTIAALAEGDADLIVTTAGISTGPRDVLLPVLRAMGAEILLHGIRMRPGKPAAVARLPGGKPILCLPGNPLAAAVAGRFLMVHAIRAALGQPIERGTPVTSDQGRAGTTLVLKARVEAGEIEVLPGQQSHMLRSLTDATHWLVTSEAADGSGLLFPL